MTEIIDLSQELHPGMPIFSSLPPFQMSVHATHEEWDHIESDQATPAVHQLSLSEHTGTHVDALSHMAIPNAHQSIDTMPLSMFYTSGICLDLSYVTLNQLIEIEDLQKALTQHNLTIQPNDTVLLYTDHYRKTYGTENWGKNPGLSAAATQWLGEQHIAAFGVESMNPGVRHVSNNQVHKICGQLGFTHYENLINLHFLVGRGRFRFIALPLKIRGGTGSPVRAVAIFE